MSALWLYQIVLFSFYGLVVFSVDVKIEPNANQIFGVGISEGNTTTIKYLGKFNTVNNCQQACIHYQRDRCWSFTYHGPTFAAPWARQCFAIIAPRWSPTPDEGVTSGKVLWPCRNDQDCSLNGKCTSGTCSCRKGWIGNRCENLDLLPASKGSGYWPKDNGRNTSSWGGAILKGDDGLWHLWAAEMTEHCGINAWAGNSRIIHATSPSANGQYTRKEQVWEAFAHEPEVIRAPSGEFVMFFTYKPNYTSPCHCKYGSTGPHDCPSNHKNKTATLRADLMATWMSYSKSANGPWSTPSLIWPDWHGSDTNFAATILEDGSLVGLWRSWEELGSREFPVTASNWKNPATYKQHIDRGELWPDLGAAGTEDQFVYRDQDGHFHAIFHHMYGPGPTTQRWYLDTCGGHAFSEDGLSWTYTGVAWGDWTNNFGYIMSYTDGSKQIFRRLERPHFILDERTQTPLYLVTSGQYGKGTDAGIDDNGDGCNTVIQPINS